MKRKLFTFLVAFLATLSGAVWGQTPIEITGIHNESFPKKVTQEYEAYHGNFDHEGNKVIIKQTGSYRIIDNGQDANDKSNVQIIVEEGLGSVNITLEGVKTNAALPNTLSSKGEDAALVKMDRCALEINTGSIVTLSWQGANKLWSGGNRAGINVKDGATLIIAGPNDQGSLEAGSYCNTTTADHTRGAGIGGDNLDPNFGTIIIESGNVTAISQAIAENVNQIYADGAGIGGGAQVQQGSTNVNPSTKGIIIIKGGNITAKCEAAGSVSKDNEHGAGIGGGCQGTCSSITIIGGTINTSSNKGYDIGYGYNYAGNKTTPQLIIAPKDKNSGTLTVSTNDIASVNNQLKVDGNSSTLNGEVTLPEGTQVYAPNLDKQANLKAYKITYADSKISEEGTHTVTGLEEAKEAVSDMYFSPGTEVTVPSNISCNLHYYIGWYKKATSSSSIEQTTGEEGNKVCTFTLPSSSVTTLQEEAFTISPVWVDMEQPILALVDPKYEWIETSSDCPTIATMPEEAIDLLTYELVPGTAAGNRLDNVKFSGNKMIGKPSLDPLLDNGYKELPNVTVKVKLTEGTEMCTVKTPMILHNGMIVITGVEVTDREHTYDGSSHNGWDKDHGVDDAYHLLTFTFTINGKTPTTSGKPREGVHYIISGYTKDDQDKNAVDDISLEIKDAGTYRNLKLKSLRESVKFNIGNQGEEEECETNLSVTVGQRQLGLKATEDKPISYKVSSIVPDFAKDWDDYVELTNKVGNESVNVTSGMTATVNVKDVSAATEDWKTKPGVYTVNFKAGDNAIVGNSNYTVAGATATRKLIVSIDDATNVDVKPGDDSPWNKGFEHVYDGTMPKLGSLVITVAGATETLQEGADFSVNYPDDVNVGDHEATITFLNSTYITKNATKEVTLKITERDLFISFKENVKTLEGVEIADLLDCKNLVSGEYPEFEGTIVTKLISDNTYEVTINGFTIKDATTNNFKVNNYDITVNGSSYAAGNNISGTVTTDPDEDGDGDEDGDSDIRLYRIYTDEVCAGVELEYSREVVKGGQSTIVTVNVEKGYDASALKLSFKRGLYGDWEPLTLNKDGQYQIKNIWKDIYVRAEGVVTGMEDIDGAARVYAKDGSLYIYTPQQDDITVVSMTGAVVKRTKQIGLQSYPLNQGIYVVRVGEQVFKIRVK
ncbi:hypothetical protein NEE14_009910 [Parabacteroides sp. AD58]|uniref:Bacterial repeat domain-containing protein n=1 Tax=Parabacteroides absconsus TaxID=2951805 RepID=A0ABZ2IH10_9BACT|nr:hypothetical protein [Parabacteroides sp. AD58]MCM6902220.1 hypothetical protein [Parabacteroides sp. AD58]